MTDTNDRIEPDDYPYDLNDLVQILGTKVQGRIACCTFSKYHECLYVVEYADAAGNPQQGEWYHEQLTLIESADAGQSELPAEEELPDNVVPMKRKMH